MKSTRRKHSKNNILKNHKKNSKKNHKKNSKKRIIYKTKTRNRYRLRQKRGINDSGIFTNIINFLRCSPKKTSNIINVRPSRSENPEESVKENDEITTTSSSSSIPLASQRIISSYNAELPSESERNS